MSRRRRGRQAGPLLLTALLDVGPALPAHSLARGERSIEGAWRGFLARLSGLGRGWIPIAIAVAVLARTTLLRIYAKVDHPGATLDDAYIHFQYARAFAEGHPFRFQPGEPTTSGATSLLWPALLAPFWLLGFRGEAILWPAWGMSFVALGALAYEARAIVQKLAGEAAAIGVAAMVIAFPAFTWFAASGMEVVPFAWLLARAVRRTSEWAEDGASAPGAGTPRSGGEADSQRGPPSASGARTKERALELAAIAWGATLLRPEGALASLGVAIVLARFPRESSWRSRAFALVALAPVVGQPSVPPRRHGVGDEHDCCGEAPPGEPVLRGRRPLRDSCSRTRAFSPGRS